MQLTEIAKKPKAKYSPQRSDDLYQLALIHIQAAIADHLTFTTDENPVISEPLKLIGSMRNIIDEKGRLSIPAQYKTLLHHQKCGVFFTPQRPDTLLLFSEHLALKLAESFSKIKTENDVLATELFGCLRILEADDQNRLTLRREIYSVMAPLKERVKVKMVGMSNYLKLTVVRHIGKTIVRYSGEKEVIINNREIEVPECFLSLFAGGEAFLAASQDNSNLHLISKQSAQILLTYPASQYNSCKKKKIARDCLFSLQLNGTVVRLPKHLFSSSFFPNKAKLTGIGKHIKLTLLESES